MQLRALWIGSMAALVAMGCKDDKKKSAGAATSASAASSTTASAKDKGPPPPMPEALDVGSLRKKLKCPAEGGHGPCLVLSEFENCITWSPITDSGDGRWLGEGFRTKDGAFVTEYTLLRSRRVPTSEVGPGQLGALMSVEAVPESEGAAYRHSSEAVRAFRRGDTTRPTNAAARYVKSRSEWRDNYSMQAKDNQVFIQLAGGVHLCELKDQRLLLVSKPTGSANSSDGLYATLWPITW